MFTFIVQLFRVVKLTQFDVTAVWSNQFNLCAQIRNALTVMFYFLEEEKVVLIVFGVSECERLALLMRRGWEGPLRSNEEVTHDLFHDTNRICYQWKVGLCSCHALGPGSCRDALMLTCSISFR